MSRAWYLGITRGPLHHPLERRPHDSSSSSFFLSLFPSSLSFRHPPVSLERMNRVTEILSFAHLEEASQRLRPATESPPLWDEEGERGGWCGVYREIGGRESMDGCPRNRLARARPEKSASSAGIWIPFMVMPCLCVDSRRRRRRRRFPTGESMQIRGSQRLNFISCL